jgi:chaperonin GroES
MLPFKKLRPLMNRVLIQKTEPMQKTKGGILLPDANKDQLNYGKVIAVGPGKHMENG